MNLCPAADYIGLRHDVSEALSSGVVRFRPRDGLLGKLSGLLRDARSANWCSPAEASKARGILQFMAIGVYGRIGYWGMKALLQRQYSDKAPFTLSRALRDSFQDFGDVPQLPFRRERLLWGRLRQPPIAASDGRLDESAPASLATLGIDPVSGQRTPWLAEVPPALIERWILGPIHCTR